MKQSNLTMLLSLAILAGLSPALAATAVTEPAYAEDEDEDEDDERSSSDNSETGDDLENDNRCNMSGYGNVCVIVSANADGQNPITAAGTPSQTTMQETPMELALPH